MANRTLQSLIENLVSDEVDKALALSNKRRAQFRKQFAEVDTLHIKQPQLNLEADQPPPPPAAPPAPVDPTAPPVPGAAPTAAGTAAAPAVGDPTAPATGMDPMAPGGAPGAPGGMPGGDPADPNATPEGGEDPLGGGAGGGSGFGGFGGGGGGGGGGGADEAGGPEDSGTEGDTGPEAPTGDPIQGMVDGAQELLNQTQDPALILKSLKGQIQTLFQNPDHALGLVKALYDTNDSVLQSVAQRLWLFLKAESPKK